MPKIVALDFGLKRIGLAITDDLNIIASGLDTVMTHEIIPFLKDLTNKFEIQTFVIGKPVQKDNTPSEIEYDILKFIKILHKTFPDINIEKGNQAVCKEFIDRLENLSQKIGLPQKLREVNIPKEACKKMASDAMKQTRLLVNNPREVTENDALNFYVAAW